MDRFDALTEALLAAERDPAVAVIVLTGRGRAFSAGADLTEMGRAAAAPTHGFAVAGRRADRLHEAGDRSGQRPGRRRRRDALRPGRPRAVRSRSG
jgi:enoyl-CoA hydratase/carnithine racemase